MTPSKPFLFCLALVAVSGATVLLNAPTAHAATAAAAPEDPMSTRLTPAMIDFFALDAAYDRPSMQALAACQATPACGGSDSVQVRLLTATGDVASSWDGQPGSVIERRTQRETAGADGVREARWMVRRYTLDTERRIVMSGTDSIVRVVTAAPDREASTSTRVRRYNNVTYLVTDPRFQWPLQGLVVLENTNGRDPLTAHAAVSFDGTATARIVTNGAMIHRADLQAKRLESVLPER